MENKKNHQKIDANSRFTMYKEHCKKSLYRAISENKVDSVLIPYLKKINEYSDFFTSSSCCGRILLLGYSGGDTKKEAYFYKKWHRTVSFEEVWNAIKEFTDDSIYLKLDPFIFHFGTNNLENAIKVLSLLQEIGVKKKGIIVAKEGKFIIEFQGTQYISLPVKNNDLKIPKEYLEKLIPIANKKLEHNFALLKKFEEKSLECLK